MTTTESQKYYLPSNLTDLVDGLIFFLAYFLFYVVTHVGIEKHSSATHGLLFAKLKSKCNVNALLKKAMYFLKMDQPRPLFAYFRSFQAHILIEKNCRLQLDSNSDRRSRM